MFSKRTSIVIGTRGSRLAIWQAEWVQGKLREAVPDVDVTLRRIKTSGDKILDVPLAKIGGKGLFVKEIEEALLAGEVDVAVHSMKDVPAILPEQLDIVSVPKREDPRDALLSRTGVKLDDLPLGVRIGTSSLRRQAQLCHYRPDLRIEMLRGNLDTRLRKLKEGDYDAIVLAAAGLKRMGWISEVTEFLSTTVCLPAIGQGALGLQARSDDEFMRNVLSVLDHGPTRSAVTAERAFLTRLEGGCQAPIAAYAQVTGDQVMIEGLVASVDGGRIVRDAVKGPSADATILGRQLAEGLLEKGAESILMEIYGRA